MDICASWHWPGNVRELRNVILRALPFCDGTTIELSALPDALRKPTHPTDPSSDDFDESASFPGAEMSFKEAKEKITVSFERHYLEDLLQRSDGNMSKAARMAGVDRKTVFRMLKRHGIK